MKKSLLIASIAIIMSVQSGNIFAKTPSAFSVYSNDFKNGASLTKSNEFNGFGCNGKNIAPKIKWKNSPAETKSFAFTIYDPDAPTGSGWWHFVSYNISAKEKSIYANRLPKGSIIVANDSGSKDYMGPCPPIGHGKHHYHFNVYALDVENLDIPANATAAFAGYMINQHKIASATMVGIYEREKL